MNKDIAKVEFCGNNYMVFVNGKMLQDGLTHNEAINIVNTINEEGQYN